MNAFKTVVGAIAETRSRRREYYIIGVRDAIITSLSLHAVNPHLAERHHYICYLRGIFRACLPEKIRG